jgi:hypothetical protein
MKATQVIDMQADLIARLGDRTFWGSIVYATSMNDSRTIDEAVRHQNASNLMEALGRSVQQAYAYHVSPDMSDLVQYAASQLEGTDRFDRSLAPTEAGIARFEKPLLVRDVRGKMMKGHWLVWGSAMLKGGERATVTWLFNDAIEDPDDVAYELVGQQQGNVTIDQAWLERTYGRWQYIGCHVHTQEQRMGPAYREPDEVTRANVLAAGNEPVPSTNTMRYVHAFWLLLNQTVTQTEDALLSRPQARRARRHRLPGRVVVVTLRRRKQSEHVGETLVEWSHRWVVRGFWRWQPCGPGRSERKRIWVAPFVKGPEDKPLIVSDKVYALHR